jgi:hypothetical protein
MRIFASLPIVVILAACSGGGPPAALPSGDISASFPAGGVANQIEVSAVDRLALRSAELVAPDGHATPANSVTANPAPTETISPQFSTAPNAAVLFGTSIGANALTPGLLGAAPQRQGRLLAIVSAASIAVPDPVAYRRDWQHYRIQLDFGMPPGEIETREIPAPEPPPPAL